MPEKLTKKQLKAQKFKQGKGKDDAPAAAAKDDAALAVKPAGVAKPESASKPSKKKKPTEDKPKPKAAPRFILFVGNLPFELTTEQLTAHFKSTNPSAVRLRSDKGIAFLEFEGDEASKNMHAALRFHHTMLKFRKINVELTAGGGGNTTKRRKKIEKKNAALQDELSDRIEVEKKLKANTKASKSEGKAAKPADLAFVHPDRLRNIK